MKKFYFGLVTLLLTLVAVPSQAQLEELSGKVITAFGPAATEIQAGQWYVMQNGGRASYAYEKESNAILYAMSTDDITFSGQVATDVAGYLVRFVPVEGQDEGYYYMQTGLGHYWGTLTEGDNNGTTATADNYYVASKIEGYDGWFGFMGKSADGDIVLDCNAAGSTVAGWGTTLPSSSSSNAAWQVVPVTLADASDVCIASITYNYAMDGKVQYSYTQTQRGAKSTGLEVVFDAPGTRYGIKCKDETKASETINEDKTFEVTYNYEMDSENPMPFEPTTIADGAFADNTKWYYIRPYYVNNNYTYTTDDDDYMYYQKFTTHPIDLHYMYAFTGNPLGGYKIYNYKKGAKASIDDSEDVTFSEEGVDYFLYAGYDSKGFSFNMVSNTKNYLNAYGSQISIYASYTDTGSAFAIEEVSAEELAQAKVGVLTCVASIEDGHIFAEGESLDEVQIVVAEEEGGAGITIAEGMETGKITLTDEEGNVVATPTYRTDSESTGVLFVTFDPAFGETGKYSLNIPAGLMRGNSVRLSNQALKMTYTFAGAFVQKTVTARAWRYYKNEYREYTTSNIWQNLPYTKHDDSDVEYYTCKVQLISADEIKLIDWEGCGDETDTIDFKFDSTVEFTSKSTHNGITINNADYWGTYNFSDLNTKTIEDNGGYVLGVLPTYSNCRTVDGYGQAQFQWWSNDYESYYYFCFDWYNDDRYAIVNTTGKVYKYAFKELGYNNEDYPSYSVLPFDGKESYDVDVEVNKDTVTIKKYEGQTDIKLTVKNGGVAQVNGTEPETGKRNVYVESPVVDGVYNGWYCYLGFDDENVPRSPASYDEKNNSGYVVLWGYDYATWNYRYIYVAIGDYTPELDKPEETYEYIVDAEHGSCSHGNCANTSSSWACVWTSTQQEPVTLTLDLLYDDLVSGSNDHVNNMKMNADNTVTAYSANACSGTYTANYTFSVNSNDYHVKSYSFDYVNNNPGLVTVLDNDGNEYVSGTVYTVTTPAPTVKFGLKGASESIKDITISNLKVVVASGSATGINDINGSNTWNSNAANGKYLRDGRMIIVNNGKTYNVAGQCVK